MAKKYQNFIGGKWVDAQSGETFENRNPANWNEIVGIFPKSGQEDVNEAVKSAREAFDELYFMLDSGEHEIRDWLVKNIKGLGMKEASHFLRNIGFNDVAIIDFHIVDLLVAEGILKKPKTITAKIYLEIEKALRFIANELDMGLGELDLYLWYLETGKVLK